MLNSQNILDRGKIALGIISDKQFGKKIGVKQTTLSSWRSRNTVNFEILLGECSQVDIDWLLTGSLTRFAGRLAEVIQMIRNPLDADDDKKIAATIEISLFELLNLLENQVFPNSPINFAALVKKYPQINYAWLMTGIGEPILEL